MLMADALEIPGLALDPRFMTNDLRCKNRPDMVIEIEKALKQQPVNYWIDALNDVGVPCAPINTIDKLFDHPQLLSRDMIVQVEGPSKVPLRTAGNPIKMHGHEEIDVNTPLYAPGLGEHRERILAELLGNHGAYDRPADKPVDKQKNTKTKKTSNK
jgi:CoA:oxalate CoA-transferase